MLPMINIIFLLLIFFMVAGSIENIDRSIRLPETSESGTAVQTGLLVEILPDSRVRIDGSFDDRPLLEALTSRGVTADSVVICRVDRDVPASELDPLLRAMRSIGIAELQIVTQLPS